MQALHELFDGFMTNRRNMGLAETTFEFYENKLIPFMEWCEIQDPPIDLSSLHEDHIDKYQAHEFDRGCNAGGVGASSRAIRTFVNFGYRRQHLARKLEIAIPKNGSHKPNWFEPGDGKVEKIEAAIETNRTRQHVRGRFQFSFLKGAGVRRAEAVGLNIGDVTWDAERNIGNVNIRAEIAKGNKARTTHFQERETWDFLQAYLATREPWEPGDPLILSEKTGERLTEDGLHQWAVRLSDRSGVHFRLHDLRHTFGRWQAVKYVVPLPALQMLMGHESITTTMIYANPSAEMAADAFAKAHNGN